MVHTKADSGGFHAQTGKYGSLHNILAFKVVFVTSFPLFGPEKQGNRKQQKILLNINRSSNFTEGAELSNLYA